MLRKLVMFAVVALISSSSAVAADGGCHSVSGTFVQQFVPCDVPAIACVDATGTGDLLGFSHTVITGFDPATQTYTGLVTITRDNGSVITATIATVKGSGLGVETITGGTRQFAHATGSIIASGSFSGNYTGQYCLSNNGGD